MISVDGISLWGLTDYAALLRWFGKRGVEMPALVDLFNGDRGTKAQRTRVTKERRTWI